MWILESSSELFQGRRMWLKPGKAYLFGRVKKDGIHFAIDNKTISRKHFIIKVDEVETEDVGNIHARTKLNLEDLGSKAGTHVNGEFIKSASKELKNEENYVKPGSLPEDLIIKWHPCVLTFNLLKKEIKAGVLKTKQERVRDLDIKAVSEYITGQTTHLVVNKRNTPKSLQALIEGKFLVAESYIDSLEYAATPSDLNEEENLSPLEQDFDCAWPIPHDHLPPPGRELTRRSADTYEPSVDRKNLFENITFVFLDQTQYDNLLPPITTGHGKAVLYHMVTGETTSKELVTFMQNTAGNKSFGNQQKDVDNGAVILVRYKGDAGAEDWINKLINDTSLTLDQRAIDQGEFLDAILGNDGMLLRQAVPFESNAGEPQPQPETAVSLQSATHPRQTSQTISEPRAEESNHAADASKPRSDLRTSSSRHHHVGQSEQANEDVQEIRSERSLSTSKDDQAVSQRKTHFMMPKKSRMMNFDDDFDPDQVAPYQDDEQDSANRDLEQTPSQLEGELGNVKSEPLSARKRYRSPPEDASGGFADDMDDLLPAAAAMKRRRIAREAQNGEPAAVVKSTRLPTLLRKPKEEKDINVRAIARAQRLAEEEKAKEVDDIEEDSRTEPGQPLPVYDVETIVIDLPRRQHQSCATNPGTSDRWDPQWNGRKNFKGFRRAKDNRDNDDSVHRGRRNHNKVIVPLVDAKTSTYGLGDQYWDKTEEEKKRDRERKRKASQRTMQSQSDTNHTSQQQRSQSVRDSGSEDSIQEANGDALHTSPGLSRLQDEAAEITQHSVDIHEPRRTRADDAPVPAATQSGRGVKRGTNGVSQNGSMKKQKRIPVTVVHGNGSDSDDSDDLKFKFSSRRRGRGTA